MQRIRASIGSAVMIVFIASVAGRGRLVDPPNRSSLWREGYPLPININDSDVNCGGDRLPYLPFDLEGGWCGVCGDAIFEPRDHELGGLYVPQYIVTRRYSANSKYINVAVLVENFLGGYFEFSICAQKSRSEKVSQECFDEQRLRIAGYGTNYFPLRTGLHRLMLVIPTLLRCQHCVLQWRWITAVFPRSDCRNCGRHLEYVNCADITIRPSYNHRIIERLTYA
ncbi:uncharacterized protein LOC121367712 isoform X2 [Gigantopelta aegis]|uniref:uncharacterized protein LOC121367712 isoform X2 n=1 Tax=Gigantopelta aegis TaxID=1735272 RepID=UPI001B88AF06|nr:uncharacterized protein LOC121367712 isoform X2 [Gigantopelta aegis]